MKTFSMRRHLLLPFAFAVPLFAASTRQITSLPASLVGADGYASYSSGDVYFDVRLDFRDKVGGNPEVIWETGTAASGFSLLYLPNNTLGLYLDTDTVTSTPPELSIEYVLPQHLVDRTAPIAVNWSVNLKGGGKASISLWVDDEQVALRSGTVSAQNWSDSTGYGGFGQSYNSVYTTNSVGGVHFTYFSAGTGFAALNLGASGSVASADLDAGLRFWTGKHIVSDLADTADLPDAAAWEGVRDAQVLRNAAGTPRCLKKNGSDEAVFDTAAPGATDYAGQWRIVPVAPGSEWFYLINEATASPNLKYAHVRTSPDDGRVLCSVISSIADLRTAQWRWDGPAPTSAGAAVGFQRLLSRHAAGGARRLTVRSSTENPIADGYAYALPGVDDAWTEAQWTKHNYVLTAPTYEGSNPTIEGASVPFVTLQAEHGTRNGALSDIIGDYRGDGDTDDFAGGNTEATAREALGRRAVQLGEGGSVDITIPAGATDINFMAVRYSIPDDFPTQAEHTVTVQVKRVGGSAFEDLKVRQVTRWSAANARFERGDATSHYKLYLNARLMWNYWRYGYFRGKLGEVPLDDPSPSAINPGPDPHPCDLLVLRNKKDLNTDGAANDDDPDDPSPDDWLSPLVKRLFSEVRCFLDTSSLTGSPASLQPGDIIRFKKTQADASSAYIVIDAIDIESVAAAGSIPANFVSISDSALLGEDAAVADDNTDDDAGFAAAIQRVRSGLNAGVWVPVGFFRLGTTLAFPYGDHIAIRGAGLAHTVVFGSKSGPAHPGGVSGFRNFGFNATEGGAALVLSDLTLLADGVSREDGGKAIGGSFGPGTDIHRVYFQGLGLAFRNNLPPGAGFETFGGKTYYEQHARTHGVILRECRVRDLSAGGIVVVAGTHNMLVENCHVRGSGDDSFAIASNGTNLRVTGVVMRNSTAEASARGDGFAIYGGYHNRIENVVASDTNRPGLWVAANFSPLPFGETEQQMTYVRDFLLLRCGKGDADIAYTAANHHIGPVWTRFAVPCG